MTNEVSPEERSGSLCGRAVTVDGRGLESHKFLIFPASAVKLK